MGCLGTPILCYYYLTAISYYKSTTFPLQVLKHFPRGKKNPSLFFLLFAITQTKQQNPHKASKFLFIFHCAFHFFLFFSSAHNKTHPLVRLFPCLAPGALKKIISSLYLQVIFVFMLNCKPRRIAHINHAAAACLQQTIFSEAPTIHDGGRHTGSFLSSAFFFLVIFVWFGRCSLFPLFVGVLLITEIFPQGKSPAEKKISVTNPEQNKSYSTKQELRRRK